MINAAILKKLIYLASAATFCLLLVACSSQDNTAQVASSEGYCMPAHMASSLKTADVTLATANNSIQLTGRVVSNPEKYFRFIPLLDGVVSKVNFALGDYIQKGTVLLEIRSPELSSLNAELRTGQVQLKLAQRQLSAAKEMYADGVASERDLLEAQQDVEVAQLEIKKVQENLGIYGGSLERGVLLVRAPFSGYVLSKEVVSGQQIEAGEEPLFAITDLEEVWVMANIYAGSLSSVQQGMKVQVKASSYPDQVFEGEIDRLSNTFDSQERVLKARIRLKNRDLLLKPEMFVNVTVNLKKEVQKPTEERLLSLPSKAMIFTNSRHQVVVYRDSCHFDIVQLEPVYQTDDAIMIRDGLKEGDKVVTENHLLIYNQIQK
ncbi:efflux RND transporter periplasmic adaptor subunit [Pontibacter qinzhouensis]|uniref:Efflux RND transporter periplasmic adaptor subunit n=2 Tax=Pontibacter qinzhouensis TaxID=2603253 RepID=A0A5C8K9J4_9BACT|nr:efflux RND transporter periplasmic adaptor subunit [Pontibacter qinzhouensis]